LPTKVTTAVFEETWNRLRSPVLVGRELGMSERSVYARRRAIEARGKPLSSTDYSVRDAATASGQWANASAWMARREYEVRDGCVIVFSDAHYWPSLVTLAHEALLRLAKDLKPAAILANGDVFDGSRVSRHDPMGWQKLPTVIEELDAVKARLGEIQRAAPKARLFKTVGNHDSRFDRRLASEVADFDGVAGFRLQDHIKDWPMSYSVMLNHALGEPVMVRHAMRGGIHAVWNNTLHSGVSIVTGHLHAQLCRPFTDYRGTRYGVDCGTLADIDGPQFTYTMDGPVNWRSGFAVLTFDDRGRLMPPELCEVQRFANEQRAVFRGQTVAERAT